MRENPQGFSWQSTKKGTQTQNADSSNQAHFLSLQASAIAVAWQSIFCASKITLY
ncbi:hypothetical protein [Helicobacter zhangjianzhongii]|uniref:hypothetical protein n=1 Tax=Helicobacter zhangjianzhongii TaxID=2974574 RepID=UPI002552D159|nr:hypothetical protein [Helicobacter sp. CPD2-1]